MCNHRHWTEAQHRTDELVRFYKRKFRPPHRIAREVAWRMSLRHMLYAHPDVWRDYLIEMGDEQRPFPDLLENLSSWCWYGASTRI